MSAREHSSQRPPTSPNKRQPEMTFQGNDGLQDRPTMLVVRTLTMLGAEICHLDDVLAYEFCANFHRFRPVRGTPRKHSPHRRSMLGRSLLRGRAPFEVVKRFQLPPPQSLSQCGPPPYRLRSIPLWPRSCFTALHPFPRQRLYG